MLIIENNIPSMGFDPDLPNANAVMASLCCVATKYALEPSLELAKLAADLAYKLMAPEYAESRLVIEVAKRLIVQWHTLIREQEYAVREDALAVSQVLPAHGVLQ